MSTPEKIKITQIGRKAMPSKFKPGDTYNITNIMDDKGRKLSAFGAWADNWKEGDVVEGTIIEKKWTDKDGFEQTSLNIENPNKKAFTPRGGAVVSPIVTAYQIAATLAPLLYASKKNVKLSDIDALADEIKKRIDTPAPAPATPAKDTTKEVDVDTNNEIEDEDDDEKPF